MFLVEVDFQLRLAFVVFLAAFLVAFLLCLPQRLLSKLLIFLALCLYLCSVVDFHALFLSLNLLYMIE